MKRTMKRLLATLVSMAIVFTTFAANTVLAAGDGLVYPAPGSTNLLKTATPTGTPGEWNVTLTVKGKNVQPSPSDVVVVIDRSASMDGAPMATTKAAATLLVNTLLGSSDSTVRIALVTFGTSVTSLSGGAFRGYANKANILSDISNISEDIPVTPDSRTNIQLGIKTAKDLLWGGTSTSANKIMVVLSDGAPNYSYLATGSTGYDGFAGVTGVGAHDFRLTGFNYGSRKGNGAAYVLDGGSKYWINDNHVIDNGVATISEAYLAQHHATKPITMYSVGYNIAGNSQAITSCATSLPTPAKL